MDEMTKYNEDYALALEGKGEVLMLLDLSGSMQDSVDGKSKRRHLFDAIKDMDYPAVTFGGKPNEAGSWEKEECNFVGVAGYGGTPMSAALDKARERQPKVVFLVSDGCPTDLPDGDDIMELKTCEQCAFERALSLGCPVNTIFIGDVGGGSCLCPNPCRNYDKEGRELLIAIARATGGYFQEVGEKIEVSDLTTQIEGAFHSMLLLPAKT